MRTLQRRLVRIAAAAVVGLAALPTGAKASLIGDDITVEVTVCTQVPVDCTDTVTVVDPAAEFTNTTANDIGTNFLVAGGGSDTNSFININDSTIDLFFDFAFQSGILFTGLEWQDVSGGLVDGNLTFVVTIGALSSDPDFSNVTASSFLLGVDCVPARCRQSCNSINSCPRVLNVISSH